MARVYLETSFISACVSTRADAASTYRRDTSLEWWKSQAPRHSLFISPEVTRELSDPDYPNRDTALRFASGIPLLEISEDAVGLAAALVRERVMPAPVAGDAVHVAIACVGGMEYILSWNVKHLANPNKLKHLRIVCVRAGYLAPEIVTPDFLWEQEQ